MLRGYRLLFSKAGLTILAVIAALAFGVLVIASGLARDSEYQRQADDHSRKYAAYTQQQIREHCFPLAGQAEANCIAEKQHEYRKDNREERDLVAQRKSANWAYIMGAAAVLGMVLSAVGVVLVWTTFREAKRSADAAHDANRPWITIITSPSNGFSSRADGFEYEVEISMTNIGNSPALDVSYLTTFVFYDPSIEDLQRRVPKWFDRDGCEWRDKIIFQGECWDRKSGAIHAGRPPGITKVNLIVVARYRTPFDKLWRYTVKVYSLHPIGSYLPNHLDLTDFANANGFGFGHFDAHQRIAGIAS